MPKLEESESGPILSFFKKIGLPGIIAALVSVIVTTIPFLFKLDERYEKTEDAAAISKQINDLTIEVGKLAGSQQVMVAIMSSKPEVRYSEPIVLKPLSIPTPVEAPIVSAEAPLLPLTVPKTAEERKIRLDQVAKSLALTQTRVLQIQQQGK